jgi:hypothetical protein
VLGFPIRTPWDHSLVDSSPRPIAASHVLHRLLVPRHPPFALDNLTTENKMLASTVQFSTNDQPTTPRPTPALRNTTPALTRGPAHLKRYAEPDHAWHRNNNPATSATAPASQPTWLFPQDPTGCIDLTPPTSRIPPSFPYPPTRTPRKTSALPGRTHRRGPLPVTD